MKNVLLIAFFATLSSSWANFLTTEFIQSINEKQTTWKAGRNFPEDTPIEQLRRLNGARSDNLTDVPIKIHVVNPDDIPEFFDSREQWPNCDSIKTIRDQGQCGSCWAFAASQTITDRQCIATNGTVEFEFSPEELISCCLDCGDGCDGGYHYKAFEYWISEGLVSGGDYNSNEGCQPYVEEAYKKGVTPQCQTQCVGSYDGTYTQDKHFGLNRYRIDKDVPQIQTEIMTNGPLDGGFAVHDDFFSYKSGVYQYTSGKFAGSHNVKIVGWGTEDGTPYWLVANSWGAGWGDLEGFFKILRGENHCGVEGDILAGEPKI
ncbi:cathepsin B-like [Zophobas morio]|uniref:cathepsin B-like n=1 Tax=Zophobas morio TaxID=2755281 RepID=UPI003082DA43